MRHQRPAQSPAPVRLTARPLCPLSPISAAPGLCHMETGPSTHATSSRTWSKFSTDGTHCKGALPSGALQVGLQRTDGGGARNLDGHRIVVGHAACLQAAGWRSAMPHTELGRMTSSPISWHRAPANACDAAKSQPSRAAPPSTRDRASRSATSVQSRLICPCLHHCRGQAVAPHLG